jgi:hypothetical protein
MLLSLQFLLLALLDENLLVISCLLLLMQLWGL